MPFIYCEQKQVVETDFSIGVTRVEITSSFRISTDTTEQAMEMGQVLRTNFDQDEIPFNPIRIESPSWDAISKCRIWTTLHTF